MGTCTNKGEITLRRKRGKSENKGRDTPVRQRKCHTSTKKGGKDLNKGKRTYSGGKGPGQREKPTQGTRKACTQKGILELKTCKLRGEYTHTQNTRYLIDFAEIEQQQNHTRTENTGWEAKYLIDFAEIEQQQNHTLTPNTRWGAKYLTDFAEIEQQQNHTRTPNTTRGAIYLIHYTEKEQQHQQNRVGKERERDESVRIQRERLQGLYTQKEEGTHRQTRYLTDWAGGVAGLRHLENTGMSHQNPEAQQTQTRLVPGILQDAVHTPSCPTEFPGHR